MLSRLREHLGGAGLIVAIVALVAALSGAAIAANGGAGDGKATASAKAKKGPRGPRGPKGPKGDPGPAGPAGAQGPKGDAGAPGANGTNGSNGAAGATGATGSKGATGATGTAGAPWTAGGTLPEGETETGAWTFGSSKETQIVAISFPIPLPLALGKDDVHFINNAGKEVIFQIAEPSPGEFIPERAEVTQQTCEGSASAPTAAPGHLCVYAQSVAAPAWSASNFIFPVDSSESQPLDPPFGPGKAAGAAVSGARMFINRDPGEGSAAGWGAWAVTAPE